MKALHHALLAGCLLCGAAPAIAQTCSQEQVLYANTGDAGRQLFRYAASGSEIPPPLPLARDYGDIAVSADGNTLHGVGFDVPPTLYRIDPVTGAESSPVVLSGPAADDLTGLRLPNALSVLAGDVLVMGAAFSDKVYRIDPLTGATSEFATYPSVPSDIDPGGTMSFASAGDFIQLDNGDILALVHALQGGFVQAAVLVRIQPDGSGVVLGRLASSALYGMARLGNVLYLFDNNGDILTLALADLPPSGSDLLATTRLTSTGQTFYGAAASGDSGYLDCAPQPIPTTGPAALVLLSMLVAALAWRRVGRH